ncbi:hydroxyacylglutathione hydrolase [Planctomycetota bacterium]
MERVSILSAWGDNYVYLVEHTPGQTWVVDPGDATCVEKALQSCGLTLTHVLVTHHHSDHIGGLSKLKKKHGCKVMSPDARRVTGTDHVVQNSDTFDLGDGRVTVLATPGHTETSVCYLVETEGAVPCVFTGDTLFVGGCGRLFECSGAVMWQSLQTLAALPPDTLVYCGHEYTEENYDFALSVAPEDPAFQQRSQTIRQALSGGGVTVPSTIGQERASNIFLRAGGGDIKAHLGMSDRSDADVFTTLRAKKDRF